MSTRWRILLVDDEQAILDMLQEHLAGSYDVDTALDGAQALDRIGAHRPDLVFLDINMPGLNGVQTLRLIKEVDSTIPVLMVTANADNALATEAIEHGAFSYVPKPFNLKYMEHLIAAALPRPR